MGASYKYGKYDSGHRERTTTLETCPPTDLARHEPDLDLSIKGRGDRIGDTDRDFVISKLREAFASGHLDRDVTDARIGAALAATTQPDLSRLTSDLPVPPAPLKVKMRYPKPRTNVGALVFSLAAFGLAGALIAVLVPAALLGAGIGASVLASFAACYFLGADFCDIEHCKAKATVIMDDTDGDRRFLCSDHAKVHGAV